MPEAAKDRDGTGAALPLLKLRLPGPSASISPTTPKAHLQDLLLASEIAAWGGGWAVLSSKVPGPFSAPYPIASGTTGLASTVTGSFQSHFKKHSALSSIPKGLPGGGRKQAPAGRGKKAAVAIHHQVTSPGYPQAPPQSAHLHPGHDGSQAGWHFTQQEPASPPTSSKS